MMSLSKHPNAERRAPFGGSRSLRNAVQCPACRTSFDEQAWGSLRLAERIEADALAKLVLNWRYGVHRGPKLRLLVVLIHIANVLYVISYLVKEILWLRLLTVVAGSVLIAYYALLPVPLWAAIGWNVVFLAINLRQIQVLLLERRPVRLSPDELRLYQLAFRSLTQCEFAKLLRIARGEDVAADQRIVTHGQGVNRIMVIAKGRARVEIAGAPAVELRPGCFVGEMSFLTGQTPNADLVAAEKTRLVTWPQSELRGFLGRDAELRAVVQMAIGEDLVAKLKGRRVPDWSRAVLHLVDARREMPTLWLRRSRWSLPSQVTMTPASSRSVVPPSGSPKEGGTCPLRAHRRSGTPVRSFRRSRHSECRIPASRNVASMKGRYVMKIQGSVALVTGSNRGLGKALVSALLEAGAAKVYAAARDVSKVTSSDPRVVPLALDTSKPEQIAAAARAAGDVTLLINNAGVSTSANVLTASQGAMETDFRTNVFGTLAVVKGFLPVLERAPGGATIVNVLSLASLGSFPALGGYSASKAASYSITQALRPELRGKRIEILAAFPGPIDTDMVKDLPIPKTSPADVASAVLAGVARGEEDIFPDPMAQQMGELWSKNPKEYERAFASM